MVDWPTYNETLVRRGQVLLDFHVTARKFHNMVKEILKAALYNMFNQMPL